MSSFASSYVKTVTAAVTRDADVLTYSSAGNIDGTKGWCYLEAAMPAAGAASSKYLISGTSGNNLVRVVNNGLYAYDGTANRIFAGVTEDGTPQKLALTWGGTATNAAINGVLPGAQGFDGDFDLGAALGIGIYVPSGTEQPFGTIRNVRIGQRQLSASEMQAITA